MRGSIYRTFLSYMIFINLCAVITVGYLWVSSERSQFENDKTTLKKAYIDQQKEQLKREVDRALDFISYMRSLRENRLRTVIKNRVYEANAIALNIYDRNKSSKSSAEIKTMIKDALRPIRFNHGRGYFFAFDMNGVETLFAVQPEMEGQGMLDVRGGQGEKVVFDMLSLVRESGEAYYSYTWTKPGNTGFFPKTAFVKEAAPLGWVIGTGEYVDDVEDDIQKECLTWISNITFGDGGYVFVGQYDGLSLTEPQAGRNMYDVEDVNGVKIVQEQIRNAKQGGGFVHYVVPEFDGTKQIKPSPKLSYAAGIDESRLHYDEFVDLAKAANTMIDERKRMEEDLHQARKMEAIGNLAGGIAHEFNNVLAIILGNVELMLDSPALPPDIREQTEQIHSSSVRARNVVRQLLNFSRKGITQKKPIPVVETVREFLALLKASLPAHISIRETLSAGAGHIMADKTQIHQVLINLCNNASQAMDEKGGTLSLELDRVVLGHDMLKSMKGALPGEYVRLSVKDTGCGIPGEYIDKIFDPYFTTKETGKGTGLGLAVVAGIVHDHNGFIQVDSKALAGTAFHVYFPTCEAAENAHETIEKPAPAPLGNETILVVDDEPSLVRMISARLERMGYTLITETDPKQVINRISQDPFCCDLVISDMSMPQMFGDILAAELLKIRPDLPIIICTGFSDKLTPETATAMGIKHVFTKPLDIKELGVAIRAIFEA